MRNWILAFLIGIPAIIIITLIAVFPFMWMWNWLIPMKFGLPTLDFWEALVLLLICNLLFKSSTTANNKN